MDGMNSACFKNVTSGTARDTAVCVTVHLLLIQSFCLKSKSIFVALIVVQLELAKKYSCKQAQQRRVKNGRNYLSRVTSSHGNRRETFLNETFIFFTMNGQWHALDVVPTIHHQLPVESPVSCISWSPLLATTCRRWGTFAYIGQLWFTVSAQQSALALNVCGSGQMTNTCCFL